MSGPCCVLPVKLQLLHVPQLKLCQQLAAKPRWCRYDYCHYITWLGLIHASDEPRDLTASRADTPGDAMLKVCEHFCVYRKCLEHHST